MPPKATKRKRADSQDAVNPKKRARKAVTEQNEAPPPTSTQTILSSQVTKHTPSTSDTHDKQAGGDENQIEAHSEQLAVEAAPNVEAKATKAKKGKAKSTRAKAVKGKGAKGKTTTHEAQSDAVKEEPNEENVEAKADKGPKINRKGYTPGKDPYPDHQAPTADACREVYRLLAEHHKEDAAWFTQAAETPRASLEMAGCGEVKRVHDAVCRTVLSGSTSMQNANNSLQNLVRVFGVVDAGTEHESVNWEKIRVASYDELFNTIRSGGLADKKTRALQDILNTIYEKNLAQQKAEIDAETETGPVTSLATTNSASSVSAVVADSTTTPTVIVSANDDSNTAAGPSTTPATANSPNNISKGTAGPSATLAIATPVSDNTGAEAKSATISIVYTAAADNSRAAQIAFTTPLTVDTADDVSGAAPSSKTPAVATLANESFGVAVVSLPITSVALSASVDMENAAGPSTIPATATPPNADSGAATVPTITPVIVSLGIDDSGAGLGPSTTPTNAAQVNDLLSLEHLRTMKKEDAIIELVQLSHIGVKTAACIALFCLRKDAFAVDTHVHRHCRWLGWVPQTCKNEVQTFNHCEIHVPDELKYGLHQLFIIHGQKCFRCKASTREGSKEWANCHCPIEHLVDRGEEKKARVDPKQQTLSAFLGKKKKATKTEIETQMDEDMVQDASVRTLITEAENQIGQGTVEGNIQDGVQDGFQNVQGVVTELQAVDAAIQIAQENGVQGMAMEVETIKTEIQVADSELATAFPTL